MNRDIASIRRDYQLASLEEATCGALPMDQFERWWEEAIASNIDEVNAFVLSTIKPNGVPSSRVVLLKGYTPEGFIFFTNNALSALKYSISFTFTSLKIKSETCSNCACIWGVNAGIINFCNG